MAVCSVLLYTAGYGQKAEINYSPLQPGDYIKFAAFPERGYYKLLDKVMLVFDRPGTVTVHDAKNDIYIQTDARTKLVFQTGGALVNHCVSLSDSNGRIIDRARFFLGASTRLQKETRKQKMSECLVKISKSVWRSSPGTGIITDIMCRKMRLFPVTRELIRKSKSLYPTPIHSTGYSVMSSV